MAAVLLIVLRPRSWPLLPVPPAAAVLVVTGVVLMLLSSSIKHSDGISFFTVTPLAVLHPLVAVALAWPALAAVDATAKTWLTAAAVTYSLIGIVGAIPAITEGKSAGDFARRCGRQRAGPDRRAHPRTAPSVAPLMNWRAKIAKTITSGTIAINAPVITML